MNATLRRRIEARITRRVARESKTHFISLDQAAFYRHVLTVQVSDATKLLRKLGCTVTFPQS